MPFASDEARRAYRKQYYQDNKPRLLDKQAKWRKANHRKHIEYNRWYYVSIRRHPDVTRRVNKKREHEFLARLGSKFLHFKRTEVERRKRYQELLREPSLRSELTGLELMCDFIEHLTKTKKELNADFKGSESETMEHDRCLGEG